MPCFAGLRTPLPCRGIDSAIVYRFADLLNPSSYGALHGLLNNPNCEWRQANYPV